MTGLKYRRTLDELEKVNSCKNLVYKPEEKKPLGRIGRSWEDDGCSRKVGVTVWLIYLAQNRVQRRVLINLIYAHGQ